MSNTICVTLDFSFLFYKHQSVLGCVGIFANVHKLECNNTITKCLNYYIKEIFREMFEKNRLHNSLLVKYFNHCDQILKLRIPRSF